MLSTRADFAAVDSILFQLTDSFTTSHILNMTKKFVFVSESYFAHAPFIALFTPDRSDLQCLLLILRHRSGVVSE